MDFSKALEALKDGKKIRQTSNPNVIFYMGKISQMFTTETIPSLIREENGEWRHSDIYGRKELFADDWEIIEEIPEVELHRSKDIYFICPKCHKQQEQLVYIEDKEDALKECRFCGQKFRFSNLEEMKKLYYRENDSKTKEVLDRFTLIENLLCLDPERIIIRRYKK